MARLSDFHTYQEQVRISFKSTEFEYFINPLGLKRDFLVTNLRTLDLCFFAFWAFFECLIHRISLSHLTNVSADARIFRMWTFSHCIYSNKVWKAKKIPTNLIVVHDHILNF